MECDVTLDGGYSPQLLLVTGLVRPQPDALVPQTALERLHHVDGACSDLPFGGCCEEDFTHRRENQPDTVISTSESEAQRKDSKY